MWCIEQFSVVNSKKNEKYFLAGRAQTRPKNYCCLFVCLCSYFLVCQAVFFFEKVNQLQQTVWIVTPSVLCLELARQYCSSQQLLVASPSLSVCCHIYFKQYNTELSLIICHCVVLQQHHNQSHMGAKKSNNLCDNIIYSINIHSFSSLLWRKYKASLLLAAYLAS